ncbi:MAG: 2-oxoacid:ferredoxin oxidoreductase subunit beta [Lachnospiraceae bacterium]|jgi:2-oxoglutarate ferredoxin oxidoreductase subunit beta|nr:2-oxoacid:ferredoxin oxidoreductase subunit beta [Lachnospiraceae bacterium]
MPSELIHEYMRIDHLPHIWCGGCGNGIIMRDVVVAVKELFEERGGQFSREKMIIVSGIGCSSRAAGYLDFDTLHTTHGRAIPFATGIKMANPELEVIVLTGDGDCSAIGGNHLIHAARRNIGMTVITFNNDIYGMTGGQYSPTTPTGDKATTAPYGNPDRPFDIAQLAAGAGASFVGRGSAYHVRETIDIIKQGIRHRGFSLIDVYSICPTYYGRKNKKGTAVDMLNWQRENLIPSNKYYTLSEEQRGEKKIIGTLVHNNLPEYTAEYGKLTERCMEKQRRR